MNPGTIRTDFERDGYYLARGVFSGDQLAASQQSASARFQAVGSMWRSMGLMPF